MRCRLAATGGWLYEEQTIGKARSALCSTAFDLHLYPIGGPAQNYDDPWHFVLPVASMTPLSRGSLRLASRDPPGSSPLRPWLLD
jgi:choline dehydrogenase